MGRHVLTSDAGAAWGGLPHDPPGVLDVHGRIAERSGATFSHRAFRRLAHGPETHRRVASDPKDEIHVRCTDRRTDVGRAQARARNRQDRPPGRRAPCSPPMARPSCSRPSSPPRSRRPGIDFFPLTVNYQEKTFAAGRIPGGYFKREGRPTEKETLVSRLIDRPIRPLFVEGYKQRDAGRRHRAAA